MAYLIRAFELIAPETSDCNPQVSIGEGFHSLQLYSNAFWLDHLLEFAKSSSYTDFNSSDLLAQLSILCRKHVDHSVSLNAENEDGNQAWETAEIDKRVDVLSPWHDVHGLVRSTLLQRERVLRLQENKHGMLPVPFSINLSSFYLIHALPSSYLQLMTPYYRLRRDI